MEVQAADQLYCTINFEETELRLGLPLAAAGRETQTNTGESEVVKNSGKRGFSETVDLKLNLSSSNANDNSPCLLQPPVHDIKDNTKPPAKARVVGWPPVRSFRKNIMAVQKSAGKDGEEGGSNGVTGNATTSATATTAAFVKVSMDGAPYLRKVDLKLYKSYQELSNALSKMFSSFTIGNCGSQGTKDFMNESKLIDLLNGSDYVPTYEDKDGDWMLVGDVPWEMFVDSCKRLRIMKGSEAIGLAPRAVEKCKNRS